MPVTQPPVLPCSRSALRRIFHQYGSPCKKTAVNELMRLLVRDFRQIIVLSLSVAKAGKKRTLRRDSIQLASKFYSRRYRFLPHPV